jgi:hypothetical protein
MKLYPRCHQTPEEYADVWHKIRKPGAVYSGSGHILPCCWCDTHQTKHMEKHSMLDEELKLQNNKSIEDIMLSKQWVTFHKTLVNNPIVAPPFCKTRCSQEAIEEELLLAESKELYD